MSTVIDNSNVHANSTLRALFAYEASHDDELNLIKGELYKGISMEDGWWRGHHVNTPAVIKIFPSNYVESVSEPKSIAASADKIHASRQARLDQMKRQSIFAPPAHKENAQDKVVHHATINPKMVVDHTNYTNDGGARKRKGVHKHKPMGVSIDGPAGQSLAEAQKASDNAKKQQKLSRKSKQSHTLRYSVFAHNLSAVSSVLLLIMSPISMLWGSECVSVMSLPDGVLGVLVVGGLPRVRVNSEAARTAATSAGVLPEYIMDLPSACRGDSDFWIGAIGIAVSLFIIIVLEPLCGNRRNEKSVPWRSIVYFLLGAATCGSAPTAIPGCGLIFVSFFYVVAAIKREHGNANPQPRGKGESSGVCSTYYFPTILRCGLCDAARGLWDGRGAIHHHDGSNGENQGCCHPVAIWCQMECAEKSNVGKWSILVAYVFVNVVLFLQRFNAMIDSGALIDYNTLRNVTEPKISNLQDCNAVRTPQPTDWPTFACAPTGAAPAPQSDVRAYCEAQLSEQAESQFESVHIGAFDGRNIQPNPIQRGNAKGMAWIVVHSPTSISFRLEASSMTGPPVAVHFHGPASALGVRAGANPLPGQGATGPTLLPIYATKEYTGNTEKKDDILGERSDACPVVGSAGEEVRCERLRMEVHPNVTEHLKRGRVYVNIHTLSHPAGEIRANLRETFVSVLDSPNRDVKADEEDDAKGLDPPEIVRLRQGQGVATFYMLDDGVDFVRLPSVDFSILVGNLLPGATGSPNKISIVRDENVQSSPTTVAPAAPSDDASPAESTATAVQGEVLQILCADASAIPFGVSIAGVRSCSTGENAGCYGNAPPDNLPEGTIVLAGGGTAATTTNVGICGPFTPLPLQNSRTPTGPRTSVGGGAVLDLATDTIQAANETVRAMRTRRASIVVESRTQGILVQGTLRSAVAVAYALPPLATKPIRMSGSFISLPGTSPPSKSPFIPTGSSIGTAKIAPSNAAGIATVRLIDPRSFAYVIELFELSGVPTNGIFIRGPGLRARTRTSQLVIHTIASPMVGNGTAAIRAATQNCELVSAALTVCAGTVRDIDESMIVALLSGQLYIDVRTARYPFGEMRAVIGEDVTTITGADGSTSAGSTAESCGTPLARNLGLSYGGAWAKAFGQCLNFNCALVLYPILRYILRKCNNYDSKSVNGGLSSWIPLHRNIDFHKLIAFAIAVCTAGHIVAHFLNYGRAPDATIARFHWHSWLTGALITFSMLFIFSGGQANVKRAHYELFFVTHRTFAVIFCVCLLFHSSGPLFWALGPAGMFLYLLEVVLRRYRGSQHFFVRSVRYVPPVMQLKFRPRHPDDFRFMEGQYLYLKCPYVSSNEWHPFTISSACGDLDQGGEEGWLSVHIRIIKDGWTENLLRYFSAMDGRDVNADDVGENELFLQLTSRDAKGQIQIGKDRGVNGKPLLLVDGPHAAPAQHYSTYDHVMMIGAGIGLTPSCSVLRSVLKYKWKKGWKPTLLRFYWVVRHSEIDSFLWFLEQLVQLEKEIIADRAAGTICNIHIFEANIYITRAPKADKCKETPLSISERVQDLLLTFKSTARRSNSVTRGLAPSPLAQKSHHVGIDMVSGGSGSDSDSKTATGNSGKRRSMVAQAGLAQTVDIGYDIEALYQTMYNPTVVSKKQTEAQQPQNIDMAENRLGSVWIWNGRPDWNQIFDQNANTPYVTTGIGVAFCGTPFIGKDLAKYCRIKSNSETGQVFHLLKENF